MTNEELCELAGQCGLQLGIYAETYPNIAQQLHRFFVEAYSMGERDMAEFANRQIKKLKQREWVCLTDDEVKGTRDSCASDLYFARAIESALKEKNK